jgi:hypothetical protein
MDSDDLPHDQEEKELTPDERMQWLRDRGVLVETPEDRRAGRIASTLQEADSLHFDTEPVAFVLIPADKSKPFQECSFVPPPSMSAQRAAAVPGGDALSHHLKQAFATDSDKVDISIFHRQQQSNPVHQLGTGGINGGIPAVSNETLESVAREGHVETFALVHPTPSNQFTGVNIYLDEVGQLKRLPLNPRASDYAKMAGYNPPPIFYGDVFCARVRKSGPIIVEYPSLTVQELENTASPWLRQAATDNLEHQLQLNHLTGRQGETQAAVAGSDGVAQDEEGGKYSWTQSEQELEVVVPLPSATVTSRDVSVTFKPRKLLVACRKESLVSIELFERIDVDGCTWTLDKSGDVLRLVATMEKAEEALWPRIEN